jgi:hypothetical protein
MCPLAGSTEMVSGEEDVEAAEEDADFGAMLEEMTALIVHEEDIKVHTCPRASIN